MNSHNHDEVERDVSFLLSAAENEAVPPDEAFLNRLPEKTLEAFLAASARTPMPPRRYRIMHSRTLKWLVPAAAAAAVVVIPILGGLPILSRSSGPQARSTAWWLAPSSAWAAGIDAAVVEAGIKGIACRERTLWVHADGSSSVSSTWDRFYVSHDSYRRDIYDGDILRETQWYVPDGADMLQTSVRFDTKTHCVLRHGGSFGHEDPVERIRFYVRILDKADRVLDPQTVDGHSCVGFEIHASKYGSNPDTWIDRIWFDVTTRLPVRIEQCDRPVTGEKSMTFTNIQDQFDYAPALASDTFTPKIPDGFPFNTSPDELLKARSAANENKPGGADK